MARRSPAATTPATRALDRAGVAFRLHDYAHGSGGGAYGLGAAAALGVAPEQVLKTLIAEVGDGLCAALVPSDRQLDLKALAAALGAKRAEMAPPPAAERSTGYVVGGISPLGQRRALPTVVDAACRDLDIVFVSGGRRGLSLELAPADLIRVLDAQTADIAR